MGFQQLGISQPLVTALEQQGIDTPTPIQAQSIPFIKEGQDVIAEAQTGTGKTLAFLLPMIDQIKLTNSGVQGLIITPTRELAIQITAEAEKLIQGKDINILAAYGGKDIGAQLKKLRNDIHLVIATPGRLLDHIDRGTINLRSLKTVVLDEADQMLFMGFQNEVDKIMKVTPKKKQTLCFSATMDAKVKKLAYRYMNNPVVVAVENDQVTLENIRQEVIHTTDRQKLDALCTVLDQDNPFMAIIFCRTKRRADNLEASLHQRGYNIAKLHSDVLQSKRERIMKSFRKGDIQYLIATDVASRGIDISGVSHIYNFDIPESVESYIHRIGRTGRAGDEGYTCLFIDPKNEPMLHQIQDHIELWIEERTL